MSKIMMFVVVAVANVGLFFENINLLSTTHPNGLSVMGLLVLLIVTLGVALFCSGFAVALLIHRHQVLEATKTPWQKAQEQSLKR